MQLKILHIYDYVVLQESTGASKEDTVNGAKKIVSDLISKNNKDIRVVYNAVWQLKDLSTSELKTSNARYNAAKTETNKLTTTNATMIWVGNVFGKYKKDGKDAAGLFVDNKHTKPLGSYLEACCIYRGIFKESPVGIEYYTAWDQKNNKAEVTLKKASCKTIQEYANNYWNKSISSLGL